MTRRLVSWLGDQLHLLVVCLVLYGIASAAWATDSLHPVPGVDPDNLCNGFRWARLFLPAGPLRAHWNSFPQDPAAKRAYEIAEAYHVDVDAPRSEDRASLARDFSQLTPADQAIVLSDMLWPRARCSEFVDALLPIAKLPGEREWQHAESLPDRAFVRLLELKPETVREIVIADLQRAKPTLSLKVLLALPDKDLPFLDDVLAAHLADYAAALEKHQQAHHADVTRLSSIVERYATVRILPQVIAFYQGRAWACDIQSAFLRYWLKHSKQAALQAIERAVNTRQPTGCYKFALMDTLRDADDGDAEDLAFRFIHDANPDVASSAIHLLLHRGSSGAKDAVLNQLAQIPPGIGNAPERPELEFRKRVLSDLEDLVALGCWKPDARQHGQLVNQMSESEQQTFPHLMKPEP